MLLMLCVGALFSSAAMLVAGLPSRDPVLNPSSDQYKGFLEQSVDQCVEDAYHISTHGRPDAVEFEASLADLLEAFKVCQKRYNTVPKINPDLRHVLQRMVNLAYINCRDRLGMSIKECSKEASITTRRQSADEEDEKWEPEQGLWFRDDKEMELLNNARHRGNRNPGRFGANLKANFNELGGQFGAYVQRYFKPGRASPARGAVMPFGGRPMPLGI